MSYFIVFVYWANCWYFWIFNSNKNCCHVWRRDNVLVI